MSNLPDALLEFQCCFNWQQSSGERGWVEAVIDARRNGSVPRAAILRKYAAISPEAGEGHIE